MADEYKRVLEHCKNGDNRYVVLSIILNGDVKNIETTGLYGGMVIVGIYEDESSARIAALNVANDTGSKSLLIGRLSTHLPIKSSFKPSELTDKITITNHNGNPISIDENNNMSSESMLPYILEKIKLLTDSVESIKPKSTTKN